ncbi:anthrone oxygenase family protein [Chitinophaga nivalis]|uniref:DUF1772 domain-containing protein n=1 Tax=Chitinophaga nivalis TaxID=2991709 RepID=A0ABT3IS72_9BACT|nr:anthrone oxygenase family protein [Chitinophaga nivalis]MCW3463525.1 DUF1772 domain-containing protein [Chitinophaga nivalis]MCW3486785.1 DUF1772 domain-containing protein [Chitinophaga nivalis]
MKMMLVITAIAAALVAGIFYGYSCSVNPGLGRLPDAGYLEAMQSINRAILNPVFFLVFMGSVLFLPVSTYLEYRQGITVSFWCLLAATVIYIVGVFGVTAAGNVPLNDALDAFNIKGASVAELAQQRAKFENSWNSLHTIRTWASVVSAILVIVACLHTSREVLSK